MGRAEEFLDKYRTLEEELIRKYDIDEKTFGSPIVKFINDKESKPYRERLNLCREIRNLLSHHPEVDGERVIEPSQSMIDFLQTVIDYITKPPSALDYATLYIDILKAAPSNRVLTVMKKMQRLGFSHVPVIEDGRLTGIFSVSTIFSYVMKEGMNSVNDDFLISDFSSLLPPSKHEHESFKFVRADATLYEVRMEFERKAQRSRRLAVVFITEDGTPDSRILGMLTPWDVIG